jgi:hypothetical protein
MIERVGVEEGAHMHPRGGEGSFEAFFEVERDPL